MCFVKYKEKLKIPNIQILLQIIELLLPSQYPWELFLLINSTGKDQLQSDTLIEKITLHCTQASLHLLKISE